MPAWTGANYLVDDCHAISTIAGKRHLRSADTGTLFFLLLCFLCFYCYYVFIDVRLSHLNKDYLLTYLTLGMRSFAVAGPRIWNILPAALRTATLSPLTFARHLKSHLFD